MTGGDGSPVLIRDPYEDLWGRWRKWTLRLTDACDERIVKSTLVLVSRFHQRTTLVDARRVLGPVGVRVSREHRIVDG